MTESWTSTRLGIEGRPLRPEQYSRVSLDALEADTVTGRRADGPDPGFSGWQIEAASPAANATFGLYTPGELADLCPGWLPVLALPPGWAFRIAGDRLEDAVSADGTRHTLDVPLRRL